MTTLTDTSIHTQISTLSLSSINPTQTPNYDLNTTLPRPQTTTQTPKNEHDLESALWLGNIQILFFYILTGDMICQE